MSVIQILLIGIPICLLLSVPIFIALGVASYLALLKTDIPLLIIPTTLFEGVDKFPLLAIPCFILAGYIMEEAEITADIIKVISDVMGRVTGGLAITTIGACMFFAAISGSGPGTVAAIGTIMIPAMIRKGYSKDYACAVSSSGGTLGILIPPSNPMIIYGVIAGVSISGLFVAGVIPGFLIGFSLCIVAYVYAKRFSFLGTSEPFHFKKFSITIWKAKWALASPIVILGGIYLGVFTPVEASVIAVLYATFVGVFIYRTITWKKYYRCLRNMAIVFGPMALIIATSSVFGKIITIYRVPHLLSQRLILISDNWFVVMLIIIAFLIFLGMFMETLSTIIILTPVLLPVVTKLGMDPIHFGVIFVVTNEIAFLTPPLGVNLFVAMQLGDISLERIGKAVLPYIFVLIACVVILTAWPGLSLFLPHLFGFAR